MVPRLVVWKGFTYINLSFQNIYNFWPGGWIEEHRDRAIFSGLSSPWEAIGFKSCHWDSSIHGARAANCPPKRRKSERNSAPLWEARGKSEELLQHQYLMFNPFSHDTFISNRTCFSGYFCRDLGLRSVEAKNWADSSSSFELTGMTND